MNAPLPINPPPGTADGDLAPLLEGPFARAWNLPAPAALAPALRGRLMQRLQTSMQAEAGMSHMRRRHAARQQLGAGVVSQHLYDAPPGRRPRPGEPLRVRLLELEAGTTLAPGLLGLADFDVHHRELLVISGAVECAGQVLSQRDYHVLPAGVPMPLLHATQSALVLLREADLPARPGDQAVTVLDADAGWPDFAPGIQRRVLWQREGQAALLYYVQPGTHVAQHIHDHDEECLMVQGDLFLDDLLLQPGDYQLAPAGTCHRVTHTDTGAVLYAHGDLELHFVD